MKFTKNGFTMIELLVAATIMIILTTIGLVSYQNANRNARNAKRKADLEVVRQSLVLYKTDLGVVYPDGDGVASDFNALLVVIADYLSTQEIQDPKDPTYQYTYESDGIDFELCSTLEQSGGTTLPYCLTNP
jgi:prepilin-type N-terminal cleavage/methylation domain-containing protein